MNSYQNKFNDAVYQDEFSWLKVRRLNAKLDDNEQEETAGIALSGGGIRSATFNLGVLQALEKHQQLARFDYLSTVSGGGYIASSLTWFKSRLPNKFPFGTDRADHQQLGGSVLAWIRAHSNFLTPGNGINNVSLLTALLTGTFINLLIILPIFSLVLYFFTLQHDYLQHALGFSDPISGFHFLKAAGYLALTTSFIFMLFTALSTGFSSAKSSRRTERLRRGVSLLFTYGFMMVTIGFTPRYHQYFEYFTEWLVHASISMSFIGILISWFAGKSSQNKSGSLFLTSIIINVGLIISSVGVFIISYHTVIYWQDIPPLFYLILSISVLLAMGCNINLVSMHGYYRNRLRDAFMPFEIPSDEHQQNLKIASWDDAQHCRLASIKPTDMPYHIINCNIELGGSKQSKYRNRMCDSFILSPLYCGSVSTGYAQTQHYMKGTMDLATACSISGAAVATNTRETRSKSLNFLLALLNLRLGCWLDNPKRVEKKSSRFNKPWWYIYMFRDMFGQGLDEQRSYIHLSDGGHFENLGIYELIRRKCKLIYAFDAGADPLYQFSDLARVTELIRVDFGAKLSIDISELVPKTNHRSKSAWAKGDISYNDGTKATLIYIKASLLDDLSEDIYGYQRQNPSFPHQSTIDQFFDETQFEAYRELGFQTTHRLLKHQPSYRNSVCDHEVRSA